MNCYLSRVFISPRVNNWRLLIGGAVGESENIGCKQLAIYCRILSHQFGEAHGFTTQARLDWYHWVISRNGKVDREFAWSGKVLADDGIAPLAEQEAWKHREPSQGPSEAMVMAAASDCSINPETLGPHMKCLGKGLLVKTALGRRQGVPRRPLSEE